MKHHTVSENIQVVSIESAEKSTMSRKTPTSRCEPRILLRPQRRCSGRGLCPPRPRSLACLGSILCVHVCSVAAAFGPGLRCMERPRNINRRQKGYVVGSFIRKKVRRDTVSIETCLSETTEIYVRPSPLPM